MTNNLPPDVANFVNSQVASGAFDSPDEVLRAAMQSLQRDAEQKQMQDELRQSLLEADAQVERGEFQDIDEAFDEIEVELFGTRLADE